MPFSQIIPPSPYPTESKRLFYTSVSLASPALQVDSLPLSHKGSPFNFTKMIPVIHVINKHLFVTPWVVAHQDSLPMGILRQEYWSGLPYPLPEDLSNPGLNPGLLLCMCSLPSEPSQKPKSTRVGSLSLLQGIFLTKDSNWGSLHCRQILCQLSYQGSPYICI